MSHASSIHDPPPFQPIAIVLALLLPGAGHAYLGDMSRGIRIAAGVFGLFFGGIFIGGIDVIDRREDLAWFVGQALVGPTAFGIDALHQGSFKVSDKAGGPVRSARPYEMRDPKTGVAILVRDPDSGLLFDGFKASDGPPNIKSIGRVNELGTLFSTIAGMLNLICIIDVVIKRRVGRPFSFLPRSPKGTSPAQKSPASRQSAAGGSA